MKSLLQPRRLVLAAVALGVTASLVLGVALWAHGRGHQTNHQAAATPSPFGTGSVPASASPVPTTPPVSPSPVPSAAPVDISARIAATSLEFRAPSVGVNAPVVSVGKDASGAMQAPEGPAGDASWKQAFWYRGGSQPGDPGTATIAGHLDDRGGRPAAFWNTRNLHAGDTLQVIDHGRHVVMTFAIDETATFTVAQANSTEVLTRLYGAHVVSGAQVTASDPSILNIITCTGTWNAAKHDYSSRFLAFAHKVGESPAA